MDGMREASFLQRRAVPWLYVDGVWFIGSSYLVYQVEYGTYVTLLKQRPATTPPPPPPLPGPPAPGTL